jgi:hypothetical protein
MPRVGVNQGGRQYILKRGALGEKMVQLKDEANGLITELRTFRVAKRQEVLAVECQASGGWNVKRPDDIQ